MPEKTYLNSHRVVGSAIVYVHEHIDPNKKYRNCHLAHAPVKEPSPIQKGFYQLKNPRISECCNFFDEDITPVENPEKKLGIARQVLTKNHKLNLSRTETKKELVNKLFGNTKNTPTILIFD